MKYLTREDLLAEYRNIMETIPHRTKKNNIYNWGELVSDVVETISRYDECFITYKDYSFWVSAFYDKNDKDNYIYDYYFIGLVRLKDWFSEEQMRALHELTFGYQF